MPAGMVLLPRAAETKSNLTNPLLDRIKALIGEGASAVSSSPYRPWADTGRAALTRRLNLDLDFPLAGQRQIQ